MKNIDFKKVIEWLSFVLRCPVCNYKYNLERTKIIDTKEENDQAHLLVHSDCSQCKASIVFNIAIDGPEVFTVSMLSDLTSGDSDKFIDFEPITTDDAIQMHNFVRHFDGDLVKALR